MLRYSNASGEGWEDLQCSFLILKVARGCWSFAHCMKSSTFREMKATRLVLESYCKEVRGKEVLHQTDNKNAGLASRNGELHQETVAVYKLHLSLEWVSRDYNMEED